MGLVQDFILLYLWLVWIKKNGRQGEPKITNTNGGKLLRRPSSSYKKLLDKSAFWTVYIAWRVGYKIVACNTTSVGVGRTNTLFWAGKTVLFLLLSMLLCILLWCWCVEIAKWIGSINVNMRFQTLCIILFFILFCYAMLHTDPHVNKDFFLFEFFSKDSLSCCKVGAMHV